MQISVFLKVAFINLSLLYVGLSGVNLYLEHAAWHATAERAERQRVEAGARNVDARYFAQCLAKDYLQVLYPDLVSHQQRFRDLANSSRFLPLGPVPHARTAYCNEGYGFASYQSDRFGFRNPDDQWNKTVDVLIVGDSFVQGACVSDQFTLSRQLSNDLAINALNVGTGSNGPNHYRHLIDVFAPLTKPKHVILVLFPNDNVAIPEADPYSTTPPEANRSNYAIAGVSAAGQAFYAASRPFLLPSPAAMTDPINCRSTDLTFPALRTIIQRDHAAGGSNASLASFVEHLKGSTGAVRGLVVLRALRAAVATRSAPLSPVLASPDATRAALDALFEQCQGGCEPIIVFLPTSRYWRPDPRSDAYFSFVQGHVKQAHGERSVRLLDARSLIDDASLTDYAPIGAHFSTDAYRRIGLELGRVVSQGQP